MPAVREEAGRHEYDGVVPDLSPAGVARGLAALGGPPAADAYDERLLTAFEAAARVSQLGEVQVHRRDPLVHVEALELACYDREYAPADERAAGARRHLAAWPDGVDAALAALDRVPADVAAATLSSVRGLAAGVEDEAALAAHRRFVAHVERAARDGDPDPSLGEPALAALMSSREALRPINLGGLAERANAERDRLRALLTNACHRIAPGVPVAEVLSRLEHDHPDPEGVLDAARALTAEVVAWTAEPWCLTTTASAWSARRPSPALGHGDDVVGGAGRAGRPVLVPRHPARPGLAAEEQEEWLRGVQPLAAARGDAARGGARALLATAGRCAARRPARRALLTPWRSSRAGRTTARSSRRAGLPRRRPAACSRRGVEAL